MGWKSFCTTASPLKSGAGFWTSATHKRAPENQLNQYSVGFYIEFHSIRICKYANSTVRTSEPTSVK